MNCLVDTNLFLRIFQPSHSMNRIAEGAMELLIGRGDKLIIAYQTIPEFLAVATRPVSANGLGCTHQEAEAALTKFLLTVEVAYETEDCGIELRKLFSTYKVIGKQVHDARLVSVMMSRRISQLLTFNTADFKRYDGIRVLDPAEVVAGVQG